MVIWIWNNKSKKEYIRKYIIVYGSVTGLVFAYGIVMFHFVGNLDKSVGIAGVTVPSWKRKQVQRLFFGRN